MGIMMKFADLLQANTAELALMDSMNMGKPISDCLNVDVHSLSCEYSIHGRVYR